MKEGKRLHLSDYRRWVLAHWKGGGWRSAPDRLSTKKGQSEIKMLLKMRALEADEYGMYRVTEGGEVALALSERSER